MGSKTRFEKDDGIYSWFLEKLVLRFLIYLFDLSQQLKKNGTEKEVRMSDSGELWKFSVLQVTPHISLIITVT